MKIKIFKPETLHLASEICCSSMYDLINNQFVKPTDDKQALLRKSDKLGLTMRTGVKRRRVKFCPFCGKEITVEKETL